MYKFVLTVSLFILLATVTPDSFAQEPKPQRDMQKETQIWKELASISPASVETFKQATEAMDRGDAKEAVAFAFLGRLFLERRAGNVPSATGARW